MIEDLRLKIRNLTTVNSVRLPRLIRRILNLLPEYYLGRGRIASVLNVTLEITYRCNLRCDFCFLKGSVLNRKEAELSREEILPMVAEAARMGAGFYITGGEPLLRSDLAAIVGDITSRGLKCGINSNGMLLKEGRGEELVHAGLDYLIVSLAGPRDVYRRSVGVEEAFERVVENLKHFSKIKGPCHLLINGVVLPRDPGALREVVRIGREAGVDGITFQHLQFLTPRDVDLHGKVWGRFFEEAPALVHGEGGFGDADLEALDREIQSIVDLPPSGNPRIYFKPNLDREGLRNWYGNRFRRRGRCVYPWTDVRIAPNGDVYPCQFIPFRIGNLRESGLGELLNHDRYSRFRRAIRRAGGSFPACARCCKMYRSLKLTGGRRRSRRGA